MCGSPAIAVLALAVGAHASASLGESALNANPIRRVVTMLQMMQKKVTAEGEKEQELFDKFMCWCNSGAEELEASIQSAETKLPHLASKLKELEALIAQLKGEIAKHKDDREVALSAIAKVKITHKKAEDKFAAKQTDLKANIAALEKAIAALEKGMSGAFLQTGAAMTVRKLAVDMEMGDVDRDVLASFLGGGEGYTPQSGQITGILKQMLDTMISQLKEEKDIKGKETIDFEAIIKAKLKEVKLLTDAIESKLQRLSEIMVEITMVKEDMSDSEKGLVEDKKFLADMDDICAAKKKEWAERCKTRQEELAALADCIKILNDDDTLELFKKTLPSASLLQLQRNGAGLRQAAAGALRGARSGDYRLGLITLALRGGKVSFEKVIGMIDKMVALLKEEQIGDDGKKMYCEKQLDMTEDSLKELGHKIGNLGKAIADGKELVATLTDEIAALGAGIVKLDKQVAEATVTRREENEDFVEAQASNTAAKDILVIVENRLNKFYNPKLYKPPPKRELTEAERITVNNGGTLAPTAAPGGIAGTGVTVLAQGAQSGKPAPPPETFGAYKKNDASGGVMQMMKNLMADLDKEIQTNAVDEKNAQAEYEEFIADSAKKRAEDSKAIADKGSAKAEAEDELLGWAKELKSAKKEEMATAEYLKDLHLECDWLIENYSTRKEARSGEIEALKKAKAVLSGADYSLVQERAVSRLRGVRA